MTKHIENQNIIPSYSYQSHLNKGENALRNVAIAALAVGVITLLGTSLALFIPLGGLVGGISNPEIFLSGGGLLALAGGSSLFLIRRNQNQTDAKMTKFAMTSLQKEIESDIYSLKHAKGQAYRIIDEHKIIATRENTKYKVHFYNTEKAFRKAQQNLESLQFEEADALRLPKDPMREIRSVKRKKDGYSKFVEKFSRQFFNKPRL